MSGARLFTVMGMAAGLVIFLKPAAADTYELILQGKVVMQDGSPPPKSVAIERVCSDTFGSAPGPITNRKGEYLWRMQVDPLRTRSCKIQATMTGFISTQIDISAFNSYTNPKLPDLVLTPKGGDFDTISVADNEVPSRAKSAWKAAMKALDAGDLAETGRQIQAAVEAAPKFAEGWSALAIVEDKQGMPDQAKEAFRKAAGADPKLLPAYLGLARMCIKTNDWDGASQTADTLIQADTRHLFPEIYVHRAVAQFEKKDLAGAEASIHEAIRRDPIHRMPRAEYILGRILEAKGDASGAREHISKYLELDPNTPDADLIRMSLDNLGKPAPEVTKPALERL